MIPASTERPSTLARVRLNIVVLMVALSVMSYFDRTIMSIAGPKIMKELGLSETEMGLIYSAFILSYALVMIPGGSLADRFGPRVVLSIAGAGAAFFTGLTALAGNPILGATVGILPSFIIIRLGFGLTTAPLYPACARLNANWTPLIDRSLVQGLIAAGAGIGGAISPFLFSWSITRYGWRMSFFLASVATAALALMWFGYVRDDPAEHPAIKIKMVPPGLAASGSSGTDGRGTDWRRLLTNRDLTLLTLAYFAVCYFEYIFFFWAYYYFGEIRQMGSSSGVMYTTALFLTWTFMSPLGGWVADRLARRTERGKSRRIVAVTSLALAAISLCVGLTVSNQFATGFLLCMALGFASSSDGPFWASAIEVGGKDAGAAGGVLNTGGNLGGFLAPVATPFIASYFGWSRGLYFGSFVVMLAVLAWFFIGAKRTTGAASLTAE